jgi:hypothetical protein
MDEATFKIPLTDVAAEDLAALKKAFAELAAKQYTCPDCGTASSTAGECSECEVERVAESQPLFRSVAAQATEEGKAMLTLRLAPSADVRLSQIEKAAQGQGAKVSRDKLELGRNATLVFGGLASKEAAQAAEQALIAGRIPVAAGKASFDEKTGEVHVRLTDTATSLGRLKDVAGKAQPTLDLQDVLWRAPRR